MRSIEEFRSNFTNIYLSNISDKIITKILNKIYILNKNKKKYKNLNREDIDLIYRWALYLSINTFLDRLIRSIFEKNSINNSTTVKYSFFLNTMDLSSNVYNNNNLNKKLMNDIIDILKFKNVNLQNNLELKKQIKKTEFFKKNWSIQGLINLLNRVIFKKIKILITDKNHMYEDKVWLSCIFKNNIVFKDIGYQTKAIDYNFRKDLKSIFNNEFIEILNSDFLEIFKFSNNIKANISLLFSEWLNFCLPISIIEDLNEKLIYYKQYLLKYNKIKYFHTTTGIFTNDNVKIFIILLKKNNIKIVGHDHGINNFIPYLNNNNSFNFFKGLHQHTHEDYFFSWGRKNIDIWDNLNTKKNIEIFNIGSVYLNELKKKTYVKNKKKFTIFFPECPSRKYMANLEEITPEENFIYKKETCKLVEILLKKFDNLNIIYKNFSGSYQDDYFLNYFSEYINTNRVTFTNQKAIKVFHKADLVLFDMLSTGFAECLSMNMNCVIFSNKFDYDLSSTFGKKINDELQQKSILFYNINDGVEIITRIIKDNKNYFFIDRSLVNKIQESICYPISRKKFLLQMNKLLIN